MKAKPNYLIKITGWLFIILAALRSFTLLLQLTVLPVDSLDPDEFNTYEPLLLAGFLFMGRGILKKKEWIRGIALWILWVSLVVGVPVLLFTNAYHPIWSFIPSILINAFLIYALTRPHVKEEFKDIQANQRLEPTSLNAGFNKPS